MSIRFARHTAASVLVLASLASLACKDASSDSKGGPAKEPVVDASAEVSTNTTSTSTTSTNTTNTNTTSTNVVTPFVDKLPRPTATDLAAVAKAYGQLGVDVYAQLAAKKGPLLISPASLAIALEMTAGGAKGDTATEMAKTLHLDALSKVDVHAANAALLADLTKPGSKDLEIDVANRLFGQSGFTFSPAFLTLTRDAYGAELAAVDFRAGDSARKEINEWVAAHTARKIENLIAPGVLDDLTRLVLADAVYFKGAFATPFRPEATKDASFTNDDGQTVKVPTMHAAYSTRYLDAGDAELFDMPFAGGDAGRHMTFTIVLPKTASSLPKVEGELAQLPTWLGAMSMQSLEVAVPRFKLKTALDLADPLQALGMKTAFDENKANFSGIATVDKLHITHVLQQTFMNVDENGTEAAAATAVVMAVKGAMVVEKPTHTLSVDRPFIVMVRDAQSGSILFLGRVTDPSK